MMFVCRIRQFRLETSAADVELRRLGLWTQQVHLANSTHVTCCDTSSHSTVHTVSMQIAKLEMCGSKHVVYGSAAMLLYVRQYCNGTYRNKVKKEIIQFSAASEAAPTSTSRVAPLNTPSSAVILLDTRQKAYA